jgi:hypothetical protein
MQTASLSGLFPAFAFEESQQPRGKISYFLLKLDLNVLSDAVPNVDDFSFL